MELDADDIMLEKSSQLSEHNNGVSQTTIAEAAMEELKIVAADNDRYHYHHALKSSSNSTSPCYLCQECKEHKFQYQCPRCSFRTCSLKCCKSHKERTGCNGKRDRTKFLSMAHMDDATMTSDYHFLEDILGAVERAKRTGGNDSSYSNYKHSMNGRGGNKRQKQGHDQHSANQMDSTHPMLQQINNFNGKQQLQNIEKKEESVKDEEMDKSKDIMTNSKPGESRSGVRSSLPQNCWKQLAPKWRHFWHQASLQGIHVLMMPAGMQRRKANTSYIKQGIIYWKVDVRFHPPNPDSEGVEEKKESIIHSLKISEQSKLLEELEKLTVSFPNRLCNHLEDRHSTSSSHPREKMHWLIQKLPSPSNRPCFLELTDEQTTLQSILKGTTLIEYPTIEAVPESLLGKFPRAIEVVEKQESNEEPASMDAKKHIQ